MDIYDVARWRPVTPDQFVSLLAESAMTVCEPNHIISTVKTLPDGRTRIVLQAEVKRRDDPSSSQDEEYLMVIHDAETGKSVLMVRTDAELALG